MPFHRLSALFCCVALLAACNTERFLVINRESDPSITSDSQTGNDSPAAGIDSDSDSKDAPEAFIHTDNQEAPPLTVPSDSDHDLDKPTGDGPSQAINEPTNEDANTEEVLTDEVTDEEADDEDTEEIDEDTDNPFGGDGGDVGSDEEEEDAIAAMINDALNGNYVAQYTVGMAFKDDFSTSEIRQYAWAWLSIADGNGYPDAATALADVEAQLTGDELIAATALKVQLLAEIVDPMADARARDATRLNDIQGLLDAFVLYVDNLGGGFPMGIPIGQSAFICTNDVLDCGDLVDMSFLVEDDYIVSIPRDPLVSSGDADSRYLLLVGMDASITIAAMDTEVAEVPVSVSSE